jgi:hypothetical protein
LGLVIVLYRNSSKDFGIWMFVERNMGKRFRERSE